MTINRYRAKSLKAAIQKAKTDLGVDAKMIHLRQLENCEDKVEIIAVVDDDINAPETQDARQKTQDSSSVTRHSLLSNRRVLNALHECCLNNAVDTDITYEILSLLNDDLDTESPQAVTPTDYLSLFIKDQISVSGGLATDKKTAIFIGPTGVGKSTTLAKLAAPFS